MAYAHVAHDCLVGDHTIFANGPPGRAVEVADWATIGAYSGVHSSAAWQPRFRRRLHRGDQDVLPYSKTVATARASTG